MNARILAHFEEQARHCAAYGSQFTAALIARLGADYAAGGPVAALIGDWAGNPRADALALRLTGALHAAVLEGRDAALAGAYPPHPWRMEAVWPAARAVLAREADWVRAFIASPPQTNEPQRAIALIAAFLRFAHEWRGPIDMLELGASAGLNLYWDRFAYRTPSWAWGEASAVTIEADWRAPAPPLGPIAVRQRAGCDLNPLSIADPDERLRLKSYVWPDQPARLARFDAAVALALAAGVRVERAEASAWLAQKLAARGPDAATIVYHSIFLQYPPREIRAAIIAAVESAGAQATEKAPLAWVRLEPEALLAPGAGGARYVIDLTTWPGGRRRIIGYTDGHVRTVDAP